MQICELIKHEGNYLEIYSTDSTILMPFHVYHTDAYFRFPRYRKMALERRQTQKVKRPARKAKNVENPREPLRAIIPPGL